MRVLQTIHLSDFQKKVLVIVKSAQTPQVAFSELRSRSSDEMNNIIGARDQLADLGMLDVGQDTLEITETGEKVMQDEYLIDEMGELTEEAQKYLDDASGNAEADAAAPPPEDDMGMGGDMGMEDPMGGEEENPFESLSLVTLINDQAKFITD